MRHHQKTARAMDLFNVTWQTVIEFFLAESYLTK